MRCRNMWCWFTIRTTAFLDINHFFIHIWVLSGTECANTTVHYWSIVPALDDADDCGAINAMNEWKGKRMYLEKICPSAAHPIQFHPASNPSCRYGKPRTSHLSYGTAQIIVIYVLTKFSTFHSFCYIMYRPYMYISHLSQAGLMSNQAFWGLS